MGIYNQVNNLKSIAINTPMVSMASFGDISLYDDKATIKYPYVNIDVVSAYVNNFVQTYTFRIYVCDRNEPYIAYNKTETILNNFLKTYSVDVISYTLNYFSLNFKDIVNGVWADIIIQVPLVTSCDIIEGNPIGYITDINGNFKELTNGDLVKEGD